MNTKSYQAIILIGGLVIALLFIKLMYDMNASMAQMTAYMATLSRDVASMNHNMEDISANMAKMQESMQRIDNNIQGIGNPVNLGGKQIQQWNPADMVRPGIPGTTR